MTLNEIFRKFAARVATIAGNPWAFIVAIAIICTWALSGPVFGFSNTWQLFINTGTTIVTLLMVFLIQNTQNRDSRAIHLKLDELLKGIKGASNRLVNVEELPDEVLEEFHQEFRKLQEKFGVRTKKEPVKEIKEGKAKKTIRAIGEIVERPFSEKR